MSRELHPGAAVEWWYAACLVCTAKWFAPFPPLRCPRCGSCVEIRVRQDPPWLNVEHRLPLSDERSADNPAHFQGPSSDKIAIDRSDKQE